MSRPVKKKTSVKKKPSSKREKRADSRVWKVGEVQWSTLTAADAKKLARVLKHFGRAAPKRKAAKVRITRSMLEKLQALEPAPIDVEALFKNIRQWAKLEGKKR